MRVVFMGTPTFAATILEYVSEQHDVVAVYTRPDAVRGRGKALVPSPVKALAEKLEIPVFTPTTLRDAEVQAELTAFEADAFVVAAYGMILPKEVLSMPKYGCLNAHASELPRWRGAAPIERAILAGDERAGICVMRMEEGLDTGDYCVCSTMQIGDLTAERLTDELAMLGAQDMLNALSFVQEDLAIWVKQDEALVTYAQKIGKHELNLVADDTVDVAWRKVRSAGDAHPAHAIIGGRGVTLLKAAPVAADDVAVKDNPLAVGQVALRAKRLMLGMSDGALEVIELKPDGKKAMEGKAFAAGLQGIKQGNVLWEAAHGE